LIEADLAQHVTELTSSMRIVHKNMHFSQTCQVLFRGFGKISSSGGSIHEPREIRRESIRVSSTHAGAANAANVIIKTTTSFKNALHVF